MRFIFFLGMGFPMFIYKGSVFLPRVPRARISGMFFLSNSDYKG